MAGHSFVARGRWGLVLHQRRGGALQPGDTVRFCSLMYTSLPAKRRDLRPARIAANLVAIEGSSPPVALLGPATATGLTADVAAGLLSPTQIALAGLADVQLGNLRLQADRPVDLQLDLQTGAVSSIERATQIPVLGRCGGGGYGSLTGWLGAATVIWHESFAEKGGNGITIANVNGGSRKLIPFFTVSDIRKVAPDLVSFTTYENPESQGGFFLTWLLDIRTGEARPVTVGATPAWE